MRLHITPCSRPSSLVDALRDHTQAPDFWQWADCLPQTEPTKSSITGNCSSTTQSGTPKPTILGSHALQTTDNGNSQMRGNEVNRDSKASSSFGPSSDLGLLSEHVQQYEEPLSMMTVTGCDNLPFDMDEGSHTEGFRRIFENYLDVRREGSIKVADITRILGSLCPDSPQAVSNMMEAFVAEEEEEEHLSFAQCANLLFKTKKRGWRGQIALVLVQAILPFLNSISTQLVFITLALEITEKRDGQLLEVAYMLGMFQTCSALANFWASRLEDVPPLVVHAALTTVGLAGWTINLLKADAGVWILCTLCFVGLSESVVCLQQGLLSEIVSETGFGIASKTRAEIRLHGQDIAVSAGSCFAYVVGGWIYSSYGFAQICLLGVACGATSLAWTALYFLVSAGNLFLLDMDATLHFRKLVIKLTAVDEIIRAAMGSGPSRHELKEVMPVAIKSDIYVEALRELFGGFLGHVTARPRRIARFSMRSGGEARHMQTQLLAITSHSQIDQKTLRAKLRPFLQLNANTVQLKPCQLETVLAKSARLLSRSGYDKVSVSDFLVCLLPRVQLALDPGRAPQVDIIFWYLYVVVLTQAVMTLCVGTFSSTALLMYHMHGMDASTAGLLLGIGEGLDCLVIAVTTNSRLAHLLKREDGQQPCMMNLCRVFIDRPLHVPVILVGISAATMLFSLAPRSVAIAAQMVVLALNNLSATLVDELTATSAPPQHSQRLQSCGQWLRRLGKMIAAFTGPMLHGVAWWLPWAVHGGIAFLWAFFLWAVLVVRAREITPLSEHRGCISVFRSFASPGCKSLWHLHEVAHWSACRTASEHTDLLDHSKVLESMEADVEERLLCTHREIVKLQRRIGAQQQELQSLLSLPEEIEKLKRLVHAKGC